MPTILRNQGLRFVIHTHDHDPAHIHVLGRGNEAVFVLNCPRGPSEMRESFGFSFTELARIKLLVDQEVGVFCTRWSEMYGPYTS